MKKDIHIPKVEGIGVAIIKDTEKGMKSGMFT